MSARICARAPRDAFAGRARRSKKIAVAASDMCAYPIELRLPTSRAMMDYLQ